MSLDCLFGTGDPFFRILEEAFPAPPGLAAMDDAPLVSEASSNDGRDPSTDELFETPDNAVNPSQPATVVPSSPVVAASPEDSSAFSFPSTEPHSESTRSDEGDSPLNYRNLAIDDSDTSLNSAGSEFTDPAAADIWPGCFDPSSLPQAEAPMLSVEENDRPFLTIQSLLDALPTSFSQPSATAGSGLAQPFASGSTPVASTSNVPPIYNHLRPAPANTTYAQTHLQYQQPPYLVQSNPTPASLSYAQQLLSQQAPFLLQSTMNPFLNPYLAPPQYGQSTQPCPSSWPQLATTFWNPYLQQGLRQTSGSPVQDWLNAEIEGCPVTRAFPDLGTATPSYLSPSTQESIMKHLSISTAKALATMKPKKGKKKASKLPKAPQVRVLKEPAVLCGDNMRFMSMCKFCGKAYYVESPAYLAHLEKCPKR